MAHCNKLLYICFLYLITNSSIAKDTLYSLCYLLSSSVWISMGYLCLTGTCLYPYPSLQRVLSIMSFTKVYKEFSKLQTLIEKEQQRAAPGTSQEPAPRTRAGAQKATSMTHHSEDIFPFICKLKLNSVMHKVSFLLKNTLGLVTFHRCLYNQSSTPILNKVSTYQDPIF